MSPLTILILIFAALATVDYVIGNRLGIGKEFEKGFMLLGAMALSMDRNDSYISPACRSDAPRFRRNV